YKEAGKRQQGNGTEITGGYGTHNFIRSISSTLRVRRVRKMEMMIARPTAASAAATTMTKKTKIWPETWCHMCAKATKVRLTALSMSSMEMKMVMMFRLIRNEPIPMEK